MRSEQKTIPARTGRWLRIGTFSLISLKPVINSLASYLPKRAALVTDEDDLKAVHSDLDARIKAELEQRYAQQLQKKLRWQRLRRSAATSRNKIQNLIAASQGKLQTVGTVFVGNISNRKPRPDKRTLRQAGGDFTNTLKRRTGNFTHSIAERGDELGQVLTEYGDDLSHQLRKRGKRVRRALQKQNSKLQKKWQRQFQQQQKAKRSFWIALALGFGLTVIGIVTYQLIRYRLQQQHEEEEAVLQLPRTDTDVVTNVAPLDAVFVGVTNTKLYYPIETPLDELPTIDDRPVDVIYFSSKQEATKQGFQPAISRPSAATSRAE